jgi:hypothetical protein
MTQQVLYAVDTGVILQWQDTDLLNYADPVAGEHALLPVDEDAWVSQGTAQWIVNGSFTTVQPDSAMVPLATLKAAKLDDFKAASQAEMDVYMASYPDFEIATWDQQRVEATAWGLDTVNTLTPICDRIALGRGMDRLEFLARTAYKVTLFSQLSGDAAGKRQKLEDQVDAETTRDAIASIVW